VVIKISTPKEATMYRRKRRILKSLVLGLAVAAVAAPPALAQGQSPDDRSLYRGSAVQTVSPDDRSLYRGSAVQIVSPDDRAIYRGTSTPVASPIVSPDDRSFVRSTEFPNEPVPVSVTVSVPSDNFQWADATLGAALMLAFVFILGSATLVIRHQRRRIAAF
jgi:hypothetical protein